jgi:hypothetical protein
VTLLVLYTLPESAPRLIDIATNVAHYANAGARIIAAQVDGSPAADALDSVPAGNRSLRLRARTWPSRTRSSRPNSAHGERVPAHAEYLIDRQGSFVRAGSALPASAGDRGAESISQIDVLVANRRALAAVGTSSLTGIRTPDACTDRRATSDSMSKRAVGVETDGNCGLLASTATRWYGTARMPRTLAHAGFDVTLLAPQGRSPRKSRFVGRIGHLPENATPRDWIYAFAATVKATAPRIVIPCDDMSFRCSIFSRKSPPDDMASELQLQLGALIRESLGEPRHYATSIEKTLLRRGAGARRSRSRTRDRR